MRSNSNTPSSASSDWIWREAAGWLRLGAYTGDARVRAEPFGAVELDLALLWSLLPPLPPSPDEP